MFHSSLSSTADKTDFAVGMLQSLEKYVRHVSDADLSQLILGHSFLFLDCDDHIQHFPVCGIRR